MGASAGTEWRLTRHRNTLNIVGDFFESVVAALIHGVVSPRGFPELGDVHSLDLGIRVEVKSGNSNNPFGVRIEQKRTYEEDPPFPITDSLYCFASYNHKGKREKNGSRPSLLRRCRFKRTKYRFLSEHITSAFLLDLDIISAMEEYYGAQESFYAGRVGQPTLVVGRHSHLDKFKYDSWNSYLQKLGLKPKEWIHAEYRIGLLVTIPDPDTGEIYENPVQFNLITVLRRSTHRRIMPVISQETLALT